MHSLKYFFVRPASNFNANFKDRDCERCKDLAKWESFLSMTREAPLTWMIEEVLTAANYQPPKQVGPQSLSKSTAWNTNNMKQRNDGDGIVSRKWMGLRYISYWIWLMEVQNNDLDYFCLRHFKHFLHMNMQGSFYLISTGPTKRPFPKLFFSGWWHKQVDRCLRREQFTGL